MTDRDLLIEEIRAESARLRRERDEARAERDNLSVEAHHWMGEAARCREALERITALAFDPGDRNDLAAAMAREALRGISGAEVEAAEIAREALEGDDD